MDLDSVTELIESLAGDEQNWVDFKQDYEIGGIAQCKAEFAKDVSSIVNSLHDRSEGYLLIGINDDGEIVGINESRISYRGEGPRHIFSYDESDIQQILDGLLDPLPDVSWHTYATENGKFGVLIIAPAGPLPVVINQDLYDDNNNQYLSEGRVYVRRGTSKEIAKHNYLNRIVELRVKQRREEILDGIHKAVEVGPEAISRFRGLVSTDDEDDALPISIKEDAEYSFKERVSREPASDVDSYLNSDIVAWKYRGSSFVESAPMWEYYARFDELSLDEDALYFLTQSAFDNHLMGLFWLEKAENPIQILLETPDSLTQLRYATKAFTALGEKEALKKLISKSRYQDVRYFSNSLRRVDHVEHNRINHLLKSEEHSLKHNEWSREYKPKNMDATEAKSEIPSLSNQLYNIQKLMNEDYGGAVARRDEFRDALWDLELMIGIEMME